MRIVKMEPQCNLTTIYDGRGGIFTWNPKDLPIVEWNFMYYSPGKVRGNHYHSEFDEYILVTFGNGVMVSRESDGAPEEFLYLGRGDCVYIPRNTPHAFQAITECTIASFLTKKWDDCEVPVLRKELIKV
ncbi:MAG: cupin domain-containing protein [Deltaproteobacteria bacterium]|nr:cupin domain-containing protein [Deltaproteobacteria bacterium]